MGSLGGLTEADRMLANSCMLVWFIPGLSGPSGGVVYSSMKNPW